MNRSELQVKIAQCSMLMSRIEQIEFDLMEFGLHQERRLTRQIKRSLILKQTDYWRELETEFIPKELLKGVREKKPRGKKKNK
jgi:hypothetical protein